jgi:hypothetical protein
MEEIGIGTRIKHEEFGQGIICRIGVESMAISFFSGGLREISRGDNLEIVELLETPRNMISFDEIEDVLARLLSKHTEFSETVDIGDKWKGGLMVLEPKDESLQVKEIPIETFFSKIIMVRDRLRVLEQNINKNASLSSEEKVHLQQYITKSYGSLTTFNVLFKNKDEQFRGEGR